MNRGTMIVRVEITLDCEPKDTHKEQMFSSAEYLTDDVGSIVISIHPQNSKIIVAEFTMEKAKQIDVVDKIGKEFSYYMEDYSDSSIYFPKNRTLKRAN